MTIHETITTLSPEEVIDRAVKFFSSTGTPSAAFVQERGPDHVILHMEVGEVTIGVVPTEAGTLVRSSGSRALHLISHFLTTIGHAHDVSATSNRYPRQVTRGGTVHTFPAPDRASKLPPPAA